MDKQLQRLIDLSNKTGDRLIVFDPRNEAQAYVVMPVDDYEKIAVGRSEVRGLTEDELLDKINRDIAIWKSDRNIEKDGFLAKNFPEEVRFFDDESDEDDDDEGLEDDEWFSVEEIANRTNERLNMNNEQRFGQNRGKSNWRIPSKRKERAEEIIEEDRYYLEDVED